MLKKWLKKIDQLLDLNLPILLLLLLIIILRIPNFFEPYWYGDEAIYLTLGNSLRQGAKLYTEIIDHKTPIIYYLAMVSTQLNFRILNLVWMLASTTLFYKLAKKLFIGRFGAITASFLFVIFSTLPWFEGNIPNGELFVIGFVLAGAYLISFTNYFKQFFKEKINRKKENWLLFILAGGFFGLGILTKVPALLDLAAFMSLGWFVSSEKIIKLLKNKKTINLKDAKTSWQAFLLLAASFIPIILSIIYFVSLGSGKDYLDYGLLYNFRYSQSWLPLFVNPIVLFLFSLKGKLLLLILSFGFLTFINKSISRLALFTISWFLFTFFASLLSNRPYPHYYLQMAPAFSLLSAIILRNIYGIIKTKAYSKVNKKSVYEILIGTFYLYLFLTILLQLNVGLYPTWSYYQKFMQRLTGKISSEQYEYGFNHLVEDNYAAAKIIKTAGAKNYFIWGTNPMLYALTKTKPVGKFTVAFHIKDFKAYDETMDAIKQAQPKIIIVMKNETTFTELNQYLYQYYMPNGSLKQMTIYLKK